MFMFKSNNDGFGYSGSLPTSKFKCFHERDSVTRFFCFWFFSWNIFLQAPENNIRIIFFLEILGDISNQGVPPVSTTLVVNFYTGTGGVVGTGGKFAAGVNDSGCKFVAGVNDTFGK